MTNVVELTLVALVSLAANFHAGLDNLKSKNYDKAIAAFTPVIEAAPDVADMKELSLLYRAEAYAGKGDKAAALKDAAAVLKITESKPLKAKAAALYTAQGGALKDLRPKEGPKAAFNKFLSLVQNEDADTARQYIAGSLREWLEMVDKMFAADAGRSFLSEIARHPDDFNFVSEGFDDTNQTASLSVAVDRGQMTFTLGLIQQGDKWAAASVVDADRAGAARRRGPSARELDARAVGNLVALGKVMKMYSMDHNESFPEKWEDLKEYVGDAAVWMYVDPKTGKKERILYRAGFTEATPVDMMVAAAPFVVKDMRDVLFVDGSIKSMDEKEFERLAAEQKWVIPSLAKKEDVDKDVAAEVAGLIKKLGDKDSKVRAGSKKRLQEIGAAALPFLKDEENNADPEIQSTVKELLK